ncbi:rod shape-determining protein MreC [Croceicoccus mobilis]|uniref:Cell shape-determining protein MreC n=1 Tax=Croceicoccus mobilis TaxID=1703339 RepID=A0A916Z475_9SPHN|nr:rod shape-determining protein MreC [Croceicoccus mobilis]GGD75411.1 hypothetical protein GCM10010990_26270 [Croceicoccus mobilis]
MAPAERRPGFSKRAHISIFTSYVFAIVGVLLGVVLLIASFVSPGSFAFARSAATDAVRPAGEASAVTRNSGRSVIDIISGYIAAGSQNAELAEELHLARAKLAEMEAISDENRRLKQLLSLREKDIRPVASARLIGSSPASTRRFALIGAGRKDGVLVGMPVRSATGLVGRVLETGRRTARILLVTDGQSMVPVRRIKGNVTGFAQGQADGTLIVRLIEMGINPLEKGDLLVTSGSGGLYRPNVPVAIVENLTRDGAVARIISDPAATDFVMVEPIWQPMTELDMEPEQ